jgi:hypothetical protein
VPGFALVRLKRLAEGLDAGRCLGTRLAIQTALAALLVPAIALAWTRLGTRDEALVFVFMLGAQVSGRFADVYLRVFLSREFVVPHAAVMLGATWRGSSPPWSCWSGCRTSPPSPYVLARGAAHPPRGGGAPGVAL